MEPSSKTNESDIVEFDSKIDVSDMISIYKNIDIGNVETECQFNTIDQQQTSNCIENATSMEYQYSDDIFAHELDREFLDYDDDDLPEGWTKHDHDSGMPVYMNEKMKVCTFAKPYFIGTNSLKNHDIPVENIPCLNYKLRLEQMNNCNSMENLNKTLSSEEYREYCSKKFNFKTIQFKSFSSWEKRREYDKMRKADQRRRTDKFKDKSQLMSFLVNQSADKNKIVDSNTNSSTSDQWTINLNGKNYVSILHEYIQQVLRTRQSYEFKKLENGRFPFLATIILDNIKYGVGIGSSKKQAKLDCAKTTLEILLPSFQIENNMKISRRLTVNERQGSSHFHSDVLFDKLKIKDSRIPEFCSQASESMPYDMLQTCVKKNFGEYVSVKCVMETMQSGVDSENHFYRCIMSVGKYSATVVCKNKREGRQKGAQALLKVLHPHVQYFGSLLRLYSHQNYGSEWEKKIDEPGNQSPKPRSNPNNEILKQLRLEMSKLK